MMNPRQRKSIGKIELNRAGFQLAAQLVEQRSGNPTVGVSKLSRTKRFRCRDWNSHSRTEVRNFSGFAGQISGLG